MKRSFTLGFTLMLIGAIFAVFPNNWQYFGYILAGIGAILLLFLVFNPKNQVELNRSEVESVSKSKFANWNYKKLTILAFIVSLFSGLVYYVALFKNYPQPFIQGCGGYPIPEYSTADLFHLFSTTDHSFTNGYCSAISVFNNPSLLTNFFLMIIASIINGIFIAIIFSVIRLIFVTLRKIPSQS